MAPMQHEPISLIFADDHPIVRKGLREILEEDKLFRIVGECENGTEALECIRMHRPDVAILDIDMPEMTGLDVAAVVHRDRIETAMLFLTITDSVEMFNRAMEYGVTGYILKDAAVDDLVRGIRRVLRGEFFFSSALASRALMEQRGTALTPVLPSRFSELTPTERTILRFIADDKTTQEIADLLSISIRTVDSHRLHITQKLDLHGSYALVRFALQNSNIL
ncbi:MAG: response regulator transcription factor [Bacteroidetes bacterium]|nr:response regulator transcription factor [Bacteroidota bacterium]